MLKKKQIDTNLHEKIVKISEIPAGSDFGAPERI